jgi:CBS domain-containing protein
MPDQRKEFSMTTVSDMMTCGVRSMSTTDTVVLAAQAMEELNVDVIPVCEGDKLDGMVGPSGMRWPCPPCT